MKTAPIPAKIQIFLFETIDNPQDQTLLITLKCHENIGNKANQANKTQYTRNIISKDIPNVRGNIPNTPKTTNNSNAPNNNPPSPCHNKYYPS